MITEPAQHLIEPARENNPERENLRLAAARWIQENPLEYGLFERFALEMASGRRRFGAKALAERVRWEMNTHYDGKYKINNNYIAYIARALIEDHPFLEGLLRFRKTRY